MAVASEVVGTARAVFAQDFPAELEGPGFPPALFLVRKRRLRSLGHRRGGSRVSKAARGRELVEGVGLDRHGSGERVHPGPWIGDPG
jgi:hypothetical protein